MKRILILAVLCMWIINGYSQWLGDPSNGGNLVYTSGLRDECKSIVSDGNGGNIILMISGTFGASVITAQHINKDGQFLWGDTLNPKFITNTIGLREILDVYPDGTGGAFLLWSHYVTGVDTSLNIQHLNDDGTIQWDSNGIKVTSADTSEINKAKLCLNNNNALFVVWDKYSYNSFRSMTLSEKVFAQKINNNGVFLWPNSGIEVCSAPGFRFSPNVIADDNGGIIVCFNDTRNGVHLSDDTFDDIDVYAQRLDSNGLKMWTDSGLPVIKKPGFQRISGGYNYECIGAISDGTGGVIIAIDETNDYDYDFFSSGAKAILGQRVNSSGLTQWNGYVGVQICSANKNKNVDKVISDGNSGMILSWKDNRYSNSDITGFEIFIQRILSDGSPGWTVDGIRVPQSKMPSYNSEGFVYPGSNLFRTSDGNFLLAFCDSVTNNKTLIQKINLNGSFIWSQTRAICEWQQNLRFVPIFCSGDSDYIYVSWVDARNYSSRAYDIYTAKVDADGYLFNSIVYQTINDGAWNNATTWLNHLIPGANANAIVRNQVTVFLNTICNTLHVQPPSGSITVNHNVNLTIRH